MPKRPAEIVPAEHEAFARDGWLAGFADGEGCFFVRGNPRGFCPWFSITLRDDDAGILFRLYRAFGGCLEPAGEGGTPGGNGKPRLKWYVCDKAGLARMVAYFDEFPLRAKKARDYALWREAVKAYLRDGCRAPELESLKDALREVRVYDTEAAVIPLSLVSSRPSDMGSRAATH